MIQRSDTASPGLRVTIHVATEVQAGDSVPIELRLENVTDTTVTVNLQGRDIVFNVIVSTTDGKTVWRRMEGQTTQSILRMETFAPGQVLRLRDVWRATAAGDFLVRGVVPTDAAPLQTEPVRFRVR